MSVCNSDPFSNTLYFMILETLCCDALIPQPLRPYLYSRGPGAHGVLMGPMEAPGRHNIVGPMGALGPFESLLSRR